MSWNHRILAHENNGEIYFQLHEVYYTNEVPDGYTANPITVGSETLKGIKWTLNKMQEAIKKPVLWAGEKFPNECKKLIDENILENFEWTDKSVIDFVNWFLDLHKLPFRYKLENMEILESFMRGDDFSVWH